MQQRHIDSTMIESKSFRVKLTVDFDEKEGRYIMSKKDQQTLANYNVDYDEFLKTTNTIENNITLRPFHHRQPKWRQFLVRMASLICMGLYLYCALLIWQMSLFNLILVGISIVYFNKLWILFSAFEMKADIKYRTMPFLRFIESENARYYTEKKVVLSGGEMGECLELQLPEDVEDMKKLDAIGDRLLEDSMKMQRERKSTQKSINEDK